MLSTVLLTMFDGRTNLASQVADGGAQALRAETLQTVIPRSVRVAEAPSYGQTVLTYQLNSVGAAGLLDAAAQEIAERGATDRSD